jgi:hypothetical protein
MHDFYSEEMMRIVNDKESGPEVRWPTDKLMRASIQFDGFLVDLRARRV